MITISFIILFCINNLVHSISIDDSNHVISTPLYSTHAVSTHSQSVLRSQDGKSVVSSYSKTVDTPHSSVRKYDSRVTNDAAAVVYTHVPILTSYAEHKPITTAYIVPHSKLTHNVPHYIYNAAHRTLHPLIYHHASPAYHLTSHSISSHPNAHPSVGHITFDAFDDGTNAHYVHY